MNDKISNILKNKAQRNQLAPLYILAPNLADFEKQSEKWLLKTLEGLISNGDKGAKHIENHPDFLILRPLDDKNYNVEQLGEIFQFIRSNPVHLKQKFIIITEVEKLTELLSNKLLKTLEEPPISLSIFLINSLKNQVLATISSRAISLPFIIERPARASSEILNHLSTFNQFIKYTEVENLKLNDLISELLDASLKSISDAKKVQDLLNSLKSLEKERLFHNSANSLNIKIYQQLKDITS